MAAGRRKADVLAGAILTVRQGLSGPAKHRRSASRTAGSRAPLKWRAIDAGPLRNAALLESLATLWMHLAMKGGQGRHVAFKLLKRG
jgi:hypothetical protein